MRKYLVEAIGTMVLVITFGLTSEPFAIGLILAVFIYGGMYVSGAHFNPAVSFAYFLRREITFKLFVGYSISQLLGAFAASGILLMVTNTIFFAQPPTASTFSQQLIVEILLSFILVLAYLSLLSKNTAGSNKKIYALGVGLTLTACIMIGKNISGAYLNPALSIGTSIVDFLAIRGNSFIHIPLFTIAPFAGASISALYSWYTND